MREEREAAEAPSRSLQSDPVGEVIECEWSPRIGARIEFTHVVADARQALQATFLIEKILDFGWAHCFFLDEVKHHPGIDLAGPRAHGQPSSAVKPIVLSMLRPPTRLHIEAPLPR